MAILSKASLDDHSSHFELAIRPAKSTSSAVRHCKPIAATVGLVESR